MFGLFGKKSEEDKLQKQYEKLLKDSYNLSKTNRTLSDQKLAEANNILEKIELIRKEA